MSNAWDTDDDSGDWAANAASPAASTPGAPQGPAPVHQSASTPVAKKPLISISGPTFLMVLGVGAFSWWAWNNSKKPAKRSR